MFRLLYILITWPILALLNWALMALGIVIVPIALRYETWPKILWLWHNDQEGCPDWWLDHAALDNWYTKLFPRFWWYAIRNPVNNLRYLIPDPRHWATWGDDEMESNPGFQWQYRQSIWMDSIRLTWGKPHKKTGKSELYLGWKIGMKVPGNSFTTQLRPASWLLLPIGLYALTRII